MDMADMISIENIWVESFDHVASGDVLEDVAPAEVPLAPAETSPGLSLEKELDMESARGHGFDISQMHGMDLPSGSLSVETNDDGQAYTQRTNYAIDPNISIESNQLICLDGDQVPGLGGLDSLIDAYGSDPTSFSQQSGLASDPLPAFGLGTLTGHTFNLQQQPHLSVPTFGFNFASSFVFRSEKLLGVSSPPVSGTLPTHTRSDGSLPCQTVQTDGPFVQFFHQALLENRVERFAHYRERHGSASSSSSQPSFPQKSLPGVPALAAPQMSNQSIAAGSQFRERELSSSPASSHSKSPPTLSPTRYEGVNSQPSSTTDLVPGWTQQGAHVSIKPFQTAIPALFGGPVSAQDPRLNVTSRP
jgi:hypothetical protein